MEKEEKKTKQQQKKNAGSTLYGITAHLATHSNGHANPVKAKSITKRITKEESRKPGGRKGNYGGQGMEPSISRKMISSSSAPSAGHNRGGSILQPKVNLEGTIIHKRGGGKKHQRTLKAKEKKRRKTWKGRSKPDHHAETRRRRTEFVNALLGRAPRRTKTRVNAKASVALPQTTI